MRTPLPCAKRLAHYTVRQAAWVLAVNPSTVSRAIRLGMVPTARVRGRLVIPANALVRLLGDCVDNQSGSGR